LSQLPTRQELSQLVRVGRHQVEPAAITLAQAFQDYPSFVYAIPDPAERRRKLPPIFTVLIRYGVLYGEVYASSAHLEGVAVWLPSTRADYTLWRSIRCGMLSLISRVGGGALSRLGHLGRVSSLMRQRHTPRRYWFLQLLGVAPAFQGRHYASSLLRAMLARIDEEGLPCYLDTDDPKNVSIYQHYGFRVVGETTIPGTGLRSWAMLRDRLG